MVRHQSKKLNKTLLNVFHAPVYKGQTLKGTEKAPRFIVESLPLLHGSEIEHFYPRYNELDFCKLQLNEQCNAIYDLILEKNPSPEKQVEFKRSGKAFRNEGSKTKNLILGGDHSVSIGSVGALLSMYPDLSVIWIDAHADINTAESTPSGNVHGQPVSYLMNLPDAKRPSEYDWLGPAALNKDNLLYIGLRDLEEYEWDTIHNLGIQYITPSEMIDQVTWLTQINDFIVNAKSKVHISFDIDAMSPEGGLNTGTPVEGGITEKQLLQICDAIGLSCEEKIISMDIVEFNPLLPPLGVDGRPLMAGNVERSIGIIELLLSKYLGN